MLRASLELEDQGLVAGRQDADARALQQLTLLILGGLVSTILILIFLVVAALQAVNLIDTATREREHLQVERSVASAPGGINEITLDAMARTLDLDDARITTLSQAGSTDLTIGIGGDRVIAWTPHLFGTRTFGILAPTRILAGAIFTLIVALIGWRVHIIGRRLDRRRALATQLAVTDALTGLSNRMAFDTELDRRLVTPLAGAPSFALLLADLDDFKAINDRFGHAFGDLVLQTVGYRLRDAAQPDDLVARIGGDEFAIMCPAGRVDAVLADLLLRMAEPIEIDGYSVVVSASIGVARQRDFPGAATRLTQAADSALYRAKRRGPGNNELAVPVPLPRRAAA
ncbi:MAG: GGDEF domain-containing protein [Devosia sp.]